MKLKDRVALVTGVGSATGRATAELFAREGSMVVVTDPFPGKVDDALSIIQGMGGSIIGLAADAANGKDIEGTIETVIKTYGRLDILCNNAGIGDRSTLETELIEETWEHSINAHLYGPFRASRLALPIMVRQGGGTIINIATMAVMNGESADYAAAKQGLLGLTKNISWIYKDRGIRCNAICLGDDAIATGDSPSDVSSFAGTNRTGRPEEIAQAALFLASEESIHLNGSSIIVDRAGWHFKKAS